MLLSKPSDFFDKEEKSSVSMEEDINESFNQYKLNSDKLDYLMILKSLVYFGKLFSFALA